MADKRKLQGEIDRCLKKVNEGVEAFDDIWQKVQTASNSNQKEKYEADLKKEIKKLQRLRDQIKTWAASNDIKDKRPLLEHRKLIETQMERFKVVERETKTKAYSKEGLGQANKVDPATREKEECREWLNSSIDQIKIQIDQIECEIENIVSGNKKKKVDREKNVRIESHRERIEKHRVHISKLELILRLLDNESLEVDRVNKLKEDVECYIENCQDPGYIEDDGMYDDLDLESDLALSTELVRSPSENNKDDDDDVPSPGSSVSSSSGYITGMANSSSSKVNSNNSPRKSKSPSVSSNNGVITTAVTSISVSTTTTTSSRTKSFTSSAATTTLTSATITTTTTTTVISMTSSSPPPVVSSGHNLQDATTVSSSISTTITPTVNHSLSYNKDLNSTSVTKAVGSASVAPYAVAVGAISSSQPSQKISTQQLQSSQITQNIASTVQGSRIEGGQFPTRTSESAPISDAFTSFSSTSLSATTATISTASNETENVNIAVASFPETSIQTSVSSVAATQPAASIASSLPSSLNESTSESMSFNSVSSTSVSLSDQIPIPTDYGTKARLFDGTSASTIQGTGKMTSQTQEVHLQPLLGVAPLGHVPLVRERKNQLNMLEASFHHLPQRQDSERMKLFLHPRNTVHIPPYHHHLPPPHIDSPEFFQRLATETLFFIFYYQEGTRAQYLAAKALKRQSWRFHTKYMMWFQRHEEPKTITDEYEQGTYIFFDYEKWSQRKREGFTFEYRYLEDLP